MKRHNYLPIDGKMVCWCGAVAKTPEQRAALTLAATKAAPRRFTGQPITGFGGLR